MWLSASFCRFPNRNPLTKCGNALATSTTRSVRGPKSTPGTVHYSALFCHLIRIPSITVHVHDYRYKRYLIYISRSWIWHLLRGASHIEEWRWLVVSERWVCLRHCRQPKLVLGPIHLSLKCTCKYIQGCFLALCRSSYKTEQRRSDSVFSRFNPVGSRDTTGRHAHPGIPSGTEEHQRGNRASLWVKAWASS